MNSFSMCIVRLLEEILHVDNMAIIAYLTITDDNQANFISSKADLHTNFTKLGKYIMISSGSWVFNKKEKGSNDVYACFRLKSQVQAEDMVNRVSFEFNRLGRKNLYKKQHQAMETKTPVMLLFVCNGTDQGSIKTDTSQMLETALNDIELNGMVPKEFKSRDIPYFTLKLSALQMPSELKQTTNKAYDHAKEHGKKVFLFKVAKSDISYFKFLSSHVHRLKLDTKYFDKFAKFTATLSNNASMSNCTCLRWCIQGILITTSALHVPQSMELIHLMPWNTLPTQSMADQSVASLFGTFSIGSSWRVRHPSS